MLIVQDRRSFQTWVGQGTTPTCVCVCARASGVAGCGRLSVRIILSWLQEMSDLVLRAQALDPELGARKSVVCGCGVGVWCG